MCYIQCVLSKVLHGLYLADFSAFCKRESGQIQPKNAKLDPTRYAIALMSLSLSFTCGRLGARSATRIAALRESHAPNDRPVAAAHVGVRRSISPDDARC